MRGCALRSLLGSYVHQEVTQNNVVNDTNLSSVVAMRFLYCSSSLSSSSVLQSSINYILTIAVQVVVVVC